MVLGSSLRFYGSSTFIAFSKLRHASVSFPFVLDFLVLPSPAFQCKDRPSNTNSPLLKKLRTLAAEKPSEFAPALPSLKETSPCRSLPRCPPLGSTCHHATEHSHFQTTSSSMMSAPEGLCKSPFTHSNFVVIHSKCGICERLLQTHVSETQAAFPQASPISHCYCSFM